MILKEEVGLAQIIFERLKGLYAETQNNESSEYAQKNELTEILMDAQELNALLYKRWRDVR